jgi:uroporphyrinogen decarboxylase
MMTPRERINAVINFKKPDMLPWCDKFFDETVIKWFGEGLSVRDVVVIEWEVREGSVSLLNRPVVKGFDLYSYFGCYDYGGLKVPLDLGPIPRFKQKVVKETERYIDVLTETGTVTRQLKEAEYKWYNMPMFLVFPVKDRETWEKYKARLNPYDYRRYPKDWEKDTYIKAFEEYQKGSTRLSVSGFYGFGAQLMGIPTFISMFYKDPELIEDMIEYWEHFTIETIKDAVETLKDRIDLVFWWEDMAEKHGPCISPKLYREFLSPHYKKVTNFLRKNKIDRVLMDSDGNIKPILDLIIDAGITGLWPLEVNAGMNALDIKQEYGNKLFLMGNLDKRELAVGGERMRQEIDLKVPKLKGMGGYIPGVDHEVHVEFSFKKFWEYADYLKSQLSYK